jgi:hypothetical protein
MARGMEYRRMGLTASTVETRESLFRLALRFVELATLRKGERASPASKRLRSE